jgi:hypothetical protein
MAVIMLPGLNQRTAPHSLPFLSALLACLLVLGIAWPRNAAAVPWMSLQAGTPCATCHVNVQGGGGRTEIGWGAGAYTGMLKWDQLGFNWLANRETNEIVPDWVSFGYDIRAQSARIGAPAVSFVDGEVQAELPERSLFLMQMQPYLTITPHETVDIYGTYYAGRGTFEDGEGCWTPYPGQSCYEAMAIVRPHEKAPLLRVGMMQPSVGIRHDDHTMLIRQDVSRDRIPVIPANYAEVGAELTYRPVYWFFADTGVFSADNLALAIGDPTRVQSSDLAFSGRATFAPLVGQRRNLRFSTLMGGSVYGAGDFRMDNVFAGLGWLNRGSILFETSFMRYFGGTSPDARNISVQTNAQIFPWLIAQARVEHGNADRGGTASDSTTFVGGFQWFILPYLEARPEYRHTTTDRYVSGQYTIMLHAFY